MDAAGWLDALERDASAVLGVSRTTPLDAPVPSCPGWSLADLTFHVGGMLEFWTAIVRDELDDPENLEPPARPADEALVGWVESRVDEALRVFRSSDPAAPCWSWSLREPHDVSFVIRRVTQEMGVHRWDAASAAGMPEPIEAVLASDGVDEFLDHFASWPQREPPPDLGGTAHLHCTDIAGEWLVVQDGNHLTFTREHAKGACAIRGTASDLLLVAWRRLGLDAVEVIGDAGVAERFVAFTELN